MAVSYQVNVTAAQRHTLADMVTMRGGKSVTVLNSHATEPLYIGGDENEGPGGTATSASSGTRLAAGKFLSIVLTGAGEVIWGISGTSTVSITAHVFRSNSVAPHIVS